MGTFKQNWKLYGLTLGSVTVIPCYYDVAKFFNRTLPTLYVKNLKIFRFNIALLRWRSIFDNTIKI